MSTDRHPLIEEAIRIVGSQGRLAELMQTSQSTVSRLLLRETSVTGEHAIRIHRATAGRVSKAELRPDLWPANDDPFAGVDKDDIPFHPPREAAMPSG